jgi:hypothetical protein
VKYLVVRRAGWHEDLLARQPNLVVPGMRTVLNVEPWIFIWIITSVPDLLRNIRTQVLIKLIRPYTTIHIPFISKVSHSSLLNAIFETTINIVKSTDETLLKFPSMPT